MATEPVKKHNATKISKDSALTDAPKRGVSEESAPILRELILQLQRFVGTLYWMRETVSQVANVSEQPSI